ncbi:helix-turn-helix domain-containing protein [Roseomonas xinghualingensis]|uniref:helix-turn-helix domain-containing protein n=1 Tax=Roseomonas xinghualingensis TaxID=2986475 RepID=UPI0021F20D83|nr:helix-turn-helix transcriptional regulator [Roseomonas sp. SXEYE001]MCV4210288.1 helix-turn-helix domain-containing protein [Roseomonas sp. SXEYE001]
MAMLASAIRLSPNKRSIAMVATMAGKLPKSTELRELIGRRLKAAREAYDTNAARVARELEITPQTWNKYEQGDRFPDEMVVVRFCQLTQCPADWLYLGRITQEMPATMAARIAVAAPDLIQELPLASRKSAAEPQNT